MRYQSAAMNTGQLLAARCTYTATNCPSLLWPQGSSRFLAGACSFPPSSGSQEELSQHRCNRFCQLLPECWCFSASVLLWKGYLLEARAFCITLKHDIIFVRTQEELRTQRAFLRGTEERGMLPAHPMSWYHLPVRAEGKVTNVTLKKKFPFYY